MKTMKFLTLAMLVGAATLNAGDKDVDPKILEQQEQADRTARFFRVMQAARINMEAHQAGLRPSESPMTVLRDIFAE